MRRPKGRHRHRRSVDQWLRGLVRTLPTVRMLRLIVVDASEFPSTDGRLDPMIGYRGAILGRPSQGFELPIQAVYTGGGLCVALMELGYPILHRVVSLQGFQRSPRLGFPDHHRDRIRHGRASRPAGRTEVAH